MDDECSCIASDFLSILEHILFISVIVLEETFVGRVFDPRDWRRLLRWRLNDWGLLSLIYVHSSDHISMYMSHSFFTLKIFIFVHDQNGAFRCYMGTPN